MSRSRIKNNVYVVLGAFHRLVFAGHIGNVAGENSEPAVHNWPDDMPFMEISFGHREESYDE